MQSLSSPRPGVMPGGKASVATIGHRLDLVRSLVPVLAIALAASCGGGGGGGGGGGPSPTPTPRQTPIPVFTPPRASPTPSPTPTPRPGLPVVILSEGETVAGDLRVNDIREAALAPDRQVAVIVRGAGTEARTVLRREDDGTYTSVFGESTAPAGLDLTTLEDVQVASDGAILFRGGDGLDTDQLYLAPAGAAAVALAGASPGVVAPEFRFLGAADLGLGGEAAFIGGGDPCETDEEGSTRCDLHLYVTDGATPIEVEVADNDLVNQNPRSPRTVVDEDGAAYFSVRGTGEEAVLLRVSNGEVATLFAVDSEVPETGELINPTLEAVGPDGRFVVNAAPRAEPTPRPLVLGVLTIQETPQSFTEITRIGMVRGAETVIRAEVIGTDDQGAVLFLETLEETDSQAEEPPERLALRLFDGASTVDVAVERERLPGSEEFVIELRDPHFNRRGEVALVAELGEIVETPSGPTATVRGTDVLVRSRAGIYTARLPAEESTGGPIIEGTALQDFDDTGTLLAIGAREEENDGLLVLVPPPPDTP